MREAREETGYDVELGPVVWVGESMGPGEPPEWHYVLIDFLAKVIGGVLEPGDDAAEARWVDFDEARRLDLTYTMLPLLDVLEDMADE